MRYLITHAQNRIKEFPQLKNSIMDLVELAKDEIDEGGSPQHEVQLAFNSIEELITNGD